MSAVSEILDRMQKGEPAAAERLLPLVYDEATALVHEAYLRLVDVDQAQAWNSPGHFFAAAEAMRRILIDRARHKQTRRRGRPGGRAEPGRSAASARPPEPDARRPAAGARAAAGSAAHSGRGCHLPRAAESPRYPRTTARRRPNGRRSVAGDATREPTQAGEQCTAVTRADPQQRLVM
jgi:hypothetical protein